MVRSFQEASNYIYIDPAIITRSLSWLVTNQQSNGAFAEPPEGRVIHTDMQVSACVCVHARVLAWVRVCVGAFCVLTSMTCRGVCSGEGG